MGTVYRATDRHTGLPAAVKLLHEYLESRERFVREAAALAELSHPAIVRHVAHGEMPGGRGYLAMEWLEGETLREALDRGALPQKVALDLAQRVADSLGAAHRRGIVHRDVKPANLFLVGGDPARVKVLDFGIGRRMRDPRAGPAGRGAGTPAYMAPEQRFGADVDARADVYALGAVLHECLTGTRRVPDASSAGPTTPQGRRRADGSPPAAPHGVHDLVDRLMAPDPADRPADGERAAAWIAQVAEELAREMPTVPAGHAQIAVLTRQERRIVFGVALRAPPAEFPEEVAARYGARATPAGADGALALLHGSGTATDQAATAARCALALRARLPRTPISVVVLRGVGEAAAQAITERGRHLLASTPQGSILVDEPTAGLLEGGFRLHRAGDTWELLGERDVSEVRRTVFGRATRFVGRDRVLASLEGVLAECRAESVARVVLVTGPAGAGKSRLRQEFVDRLSPPAEAFVGRGDEVSSGSPFSLIAGAVRRAAGILASDPDDVARAKVRARVGRRVAAARVDRTGALVGELAGVPFPPDAFEGLAAMRRDARMLGDAMQRAFEDFLLAECEAGPRVLILEDLHWGDPPSVRFVDSALRNLADCPLLVLALARPEVDRQFPGLFGERDLEEIRLGPLTRRASRTLVRDLLRGDDVDAVVDEATLTRVVERGDGNPLLLEELARASVAGRTDLPETAAGVLQARLDDLGAEAKRILRAASVFGERFWRGGLLELLGGEMSTPDVDAWLAELVGREVIVRRGDAAGPQGAEYQFVHALVRDAAYEMLTEEDRALAHRLAAAWLEAAGRPDAGVLARHWDQAGDAERFVSWCARAAEQALEGNDLEGALERADRGVQSGARGQTLASLRLLQSEAHRWRGEHADALGAADMSAAQCAPGSDGWMRAAREAIQAAGRLENIDELRRWVEAARNAPTDPDAAESRVVCLASGVIWLIEFGQTDLVEDLTTRLEQETRGVDFGPRARAFLSAVDARRTFQQGDLSAAVVACEGLHDLFTRVGDLRSACSYHSNAGLALVELGAYERAEATLRRSLAEADRLSISAGSQSIVANLGAVVFRLGRPDEARALLERVRGARVLGPIEAAARGTLSAMACAEGDFERAELEAKAALRRATLPRYRARALAHLARARSSAGRSDEALAAAREAVAIVDQEGGLEFSEPFVRLAHVECLAVSEPDAARIAARDARERLLLRASRISDPALRETYLRVPEHARTVQIASELEGDGAAPSAPAASVPAQASRFLGREAEMEDLAARLGRGRLVTVRGGPGVGKSRLVSEVARRLQDVVVIDGVRGDDPEVLRSARTLLADPRGPRVLVASRERLGLPEESVLDLAPLAPRDASALFVDRARRARPDYAHGERDEAAVTVVVRALGGIPLAIEGAAARAHDMTPVQIARKLATSIDLTWESAFDASWERLSAHEQTALAQCAALAERFTLAEAEAIVDVSAHAAAPPTGEILSALRERSLLAGDPGGPFTIAGPVRTSAAARAARSAPPAPPGPDALVIAASGRWFRVPTRRAVSLARRHALRLILKRLAEHRLAAPGGALTLDALLEAGWSGERMHPEAGARRVYTAVWTLRRMGLGELLLSRDDGYLLGAVVAIEED